MKKICFLVVVSTLLFTACKKEFTITVQSNNEKWGSVTGGGTYTKGETVQLTATPASGFKFEKWNDENIDNPRSVKVKNNATYIATFSALSFSVSKNTKVVFSPGNLQWSATNGGTTATTHTVSVGGTAEGTWRFAPNQWETIGTGNNNISSTYSGWVDLFGWGTSGFDGKMPYLISTTETDYGNGSNNIAGTLDDWGVFNAIYNTKTQTTDAPGTWRTMTSEEWLYLFNTRITSSGIRYAKGLVNDVCGVIIVPDNWSSSVYTLNNTNVSDADYTSNIINADNWIKMEDAGCVFLPAAGTRNGTSVLDAGAYGYYWSATHYLSNYAYHLYCWSNEINPSRYYNRNRGFSIRLVQDVQ